MFQAEGGPGGGFVSVATGADGGMMQYQPDDVLDYLAGDDIDADLRKIESLGGVIVVPKTEIPQTGWSGVFTDPTGNKLALYAAMPRQG
jgi:uncharacterized protein